MLNRTSSHICGRWYFPMFLLRDGLFTLMYTASSIVLIRFWSSLPTILKLSMVFLWPVMLKWSYIGEGGLKMFIEPLSKCSWWLPYILLITLHPAAFVSIDDTTLLCDGIIIFGNHQEAFDGIASFKMYLYSMFSAHILRLLLSPFTYGTTIQDPWWLVVALAQMFVPLLFWSWFIGALIFIFTLFRAHCRVVVFH